MHVFACNLELDVSYDVIMHVMTPAAAWTSHPHSGAALLVCAQLRRCTVAMSSP